MKINRHNYEEYFILYADKELNSDERRMVEEFVSLNPDLKDELDSFCSTVLLPDVSVQFTNKEELLHYDDSLISYIDDELPANEKAELEKLVAATPSLQKELELYRKTKLQPEEIVFENKSVLYRHAERKVVRMAWVRWAAAAVILLAVSVTAIVVFNNSSKEVNPEFAKTNEEVKRKTETDPQNLATNPQQTPTSSSPGENKKPSNLVDQKDKEAIAEIGDKQKGIKKPQSNLPENKNDVILVGQKDNNLPKPDNNPYYAEVTPDKKTTVPIDGPVYGRKNNVNEFTTASVDVTNKSSTTYIQTGGPSVQPDPGYPEDEEGGNKKSRGLLRKITRVFEKNTGIKATTDDDKLHIMAFTVKLK